MLSDNKNLETKDKEHSEVEVGEDSTKYGEFISSYFAWITLPEQKERTKKLEKITKSSNNNKTENEYDIEKNKKRKKNWEKKRKR